MRQHLKIFTNVGGVNYPNLEKEFDEWVGEMKRKYTSFEVVNLVPHIENGYIHLFVIWKTNS
ncbi:MAG: hypothetical protein A2Y67_01440 [Candidatus Buchananbacteria bacterium RBG_13_39_9]|uniref:ABM domain-containing protein n=1 Tax=Candidatus Buchananbacteria bacterium RBG_13_39_9 TaxID=1797531 RepID=A0A1G1XRP7_9BACT|nr:MAG: hypothetical protein A2Y67_01440 [Candidatus Buchananbacteria bacterium RBG_13_39_9]